MEIVGHQKQWRFFKKNLQLDRLSHAYLFSGLESIGKKTLALELIKLINCEAEETKEKPCQQCRACKTIQKNNFPDLLIIGSRNELKEQAPIQISQIRELQRFLSFRPYYGHWKSVILDGAENMTPEAQSCLLKTLEEVKGRALLILISSHSERLLPTIYSRCQIIKFSPVSHIEIKNYFVNQKVPEKKAEMLSNISQGKPGRAINFLLNPERLEEEIQTLKEILEVCDGNLASRFQYLKSLTSSDRDLKEVLEILQRYFRHILFLKTGVLEFLDEIILIGLSQALVSKKLKSYSISKVKRIIKFIESINFYLSVTNINPKLALEILFMEF